MNSVASGSGEGASTTEREAVRFGIVRRILPQPLCTLAPRGIVVDSIASANSSLVAAPGLPGQADARLQCGLVELNSCPFVCALSSNQELTGGWIKVRLTVANFGNGSRQIPSETKIKRNVFRHPPVVLNKWPENLPAAARDSTFESLIVDGQARQTEEQI